MVVHCDPTSPKNLTVTRAHSRARRTNPHAAGLLAIATVLVGVLNYAYTLLLTYRLPFGNYSVFAGAQSLLFVNGVIGSVGIPWLLAKETAIARQDDDQVRLRRAITFAFWGNLGVGLAASAASGGLVLIFATVPEALLVAGSTLAITIGSTGVGVLQGRGQTTVMALVIVGEVVVKLTVGLLLVYQVQASALCALGGVFAGACILLVTLPVVLKDIGRPNSPRSDSALWRDSARIGGVQVGVGVVSSLDTFLVASLGSIRGLGSTYQVAATLGKVPLFISSAVSTAVFPTLTRAHGHTRRLEALQTYSAVAGFIWLALLTAPDPLVHRLFPSDYGSLTRWLPYTAAAGVGLGLLNLLTTFVQSYPPPARRRPGVGPMFIALAAVVAFVAMLGCRSRRPAGARDRRGGGGLDIGGSVRPAPGRTDGAGPIRAEPRQPQTALPVGRAARIADGLRPGPARGCGRLLLSWEDCSSSRAPFPNSNSDGAASRTHRFIRFRTDKPGLLTVDRRGLPR